MTFASVVIGRVSVWESRYLLYCLDNNVTCSETVACLDEWVAWSFAELQEGRWFDRGPHNQELPYRKGKGGHSLAEGWRGILCFHRGDEKYTQKAFKMKVAANSEQVCWRCKASRLPGSELLYTHFGPGARHRLTMLGLQEFIADTCRPTPWIRLPGFHPSMLHYDLLHVFDLTVVGDCAASVAWQFSGLRAVFSSGPSRTS